jgi:hypothetical protein
LKSVLRSAATSTTRIRDDAPANSGVA